VLLAGNVAPGRKKQTERFSLLYFLEATVNQMLTGTLPIELILFLEYLEKWV